MAKPMSSFVLLVLFLILLFNSSLAIPVTYDVLSLGAESDGKTDSSKAFLHAWSKACGSTKAATIYVPPGRFLLGKVEFKGQCNNNDIVIRLDGTLVAPSIITLSEMMEIGLCLNMLMEFLLMVALLMVKVLACGLARRLARVAPAVPRIGSLGKDKEEAGVQNVTVKTVTFTGTQNGVRIKSWGRPSSGFARNILFQHAIMNNVQNPIVVDQNYCPNNKNCPGQASRVKISDVKYQDIHGTSKSEVVVKFDCSSRYPCSGISLEDVKLTYHNQPAKASCSHADGSVSGIVQPNSCLLQ
ncbi:hypothetical protein Pint_26400 [Pistacia integerrima]|uniref:Uncharacterized protein n=1 Tax=Pistacia integerrima TaxID=434235 RepID=A0ACC0YJL2_9ROSI|nr:hypothetical protein Pint_26400 [Pistacia integerrima]